MPLNMVVAYTLVFCRTTVALVFLMSSISKAVDMEPFRQTIDTFGILAHRYIHVFALFLVFCEAAVVFCMFFGQSLLLPGFFLAIVLLLLFSIALASVLVRRMNLACNCFGPSNKPVTHFDLVRNIGFILCALAANFILFTAKYAQYTLSMLEWITIGLSAVVFVLLWTQFGDIVQFLHQK